YDGKIFGNQAGTLYAGAPVLHIEWTASGRIDSSFNPETGPDYEVNSFVVQSDGKIVIGGWFTAVNGSTRNYIARLNSDGSLDNAYNPLLNSGVYSMALQPDGKIVVVGDFSQVNGVPHDTIVRLKIDGTTDSTSPLGPAGYTIRDVALQAD